MSNKMWGGRFAEVPPKFVEEFGAVIKVETRLCPYDIQGSLAHVTMLGETGILKAEDVEKIKEGLKLVGKEIEEGKFTFNAEDEDIHMAIEKRLTELIGPAGGRLHTGRSRNDQCCVDSYLYFRDAAKECQRLIVEIQKSLYEPARPRYVPDGTGRKEVRCDYAGLHSPASRSARLGFSLADGLLLDAQTRLRETSGIP